MSIDDNEYRWKSRGMGSKVVVRQLTVTYPNITLSSVPHFHQLVAKSTNAIVAQSHNRRRSSFFRKPRDMSLEISEVVSHAVDIILLTFILVWRERQNERSKAMDMINPNSISAPVE